MMEMSCEQHMHREDCDQLSLSVRVHLLCPLFCPFQLLAVFIGRHVSSGKNDSMASLCDYDKSLSGDKPDHTEDRYITRAKTVDLYFLSFDND